MSVATLNDHIVLNEKGVPVVRGTRMKVIFIAVNATANGLTANEIHEQFPFLSLAQIHSALAYYYDHREELDADIERREREAEKVFRELGPTELAKKARALRGKK